MSEASNPDPRYWKISPEEAAKYWDAWRESGFIAIGWNDLGDVLGLTAPECQARRDGLIAQHDDWTEARLDQVWDFAYITEGDRVVANQGIGKVLGIGTVIGAYEFVPGADLGHRLPVQWDDLLSIARIVSARLRAIRAIGSHAALLRYCAVSRERRSRDRNSAISRAFMAIALSREE
jgi:hypothetical protein